MAQTFEVLMPIGEVQRGLMGGLELRKLRVTSFRTELARIQVLSAKDRIHVTKPASPE